MSGKGESATEQDEVQGERTLRHLVRSAITRRRFIGGTVVGGAAVVLSHFLPPLPRQFSVFGPGTALATCTPPCPPTCGGCMEYSSSTCWDYCPEPPDGVCDRADLYWRYLPYNPACCCDILCGGIYYIYCHDPSCYGYCYN